MDKISKLWKEWGGGTLLLLAALGFAFSYGVYHTWRQRFPARNSGSKPALPPLLLKAGTLDVLPHNPLGGVRSNAWAAGNETWFVGGSRNDGSQGFLSVFHNRANTRREALPAYPDLLAASSDGRWIAGHVVNQKRGLDLYVWNTRPWQKRVGGFSHGVVAMTSPLGQNQYLFVVLSNGEVYRWRYEDNFDQAELAGYIPLDEPVDALGSSLATFDLRGLATPAGEVYLAFTGQGHMPGYLLSGSLTGTLTARTLKLRPAPGVTVKGIKNVNLTVPLASAFWPGAQPRLVLLGATQVGAYNLPDLATVWERPVDTSYQSVHYQVHQAESSVSVGDPYLAVTYRGQLLLWRKVEAPEPLSLAVNHPHRVFTSAFTDARGLYLLVSYWGEGRPLGEDGLIYSYDTGEVAYMLYN